METLHIIFFTSIFLLSSFILKLLGGKSVGDPNYVPVLGTVFDQLFYFNQLFDQFTIMAKGHKTFRLIAPGRSEIYTADPHNIEHFLKTRFDKYSKGKVTQEVWCDLFGEGILLVDGDKWRRQRKLASSEFSVKVLRDFSCLVFRQNAAKLASVIDGFASQAFDAQALLMRYTLDSIFKVGFGVDLNCIGGTNEEGNKFIKVFDNSTEIVYWRHLDPFWKIKRYFSIWGEGPMKKNIEFIHDFVDKVIQNKREQMKNEENYDELNFLCEFAVMKNDKGDILSRFLLESMKDPETITDQHLRDIILNFIVAGKDTTANTLSWFIYVLCKNLDIQETIAQEIKQVLQCTSDGLIDKFIESITDEALEEMHYLHAALAETLRLYPAVPLDGRCAEADDMLPDGFKLKKGDTINFLAYPMGRMSYLWGDDAEEFKPERWLKNGIFQPESPFKFIAFNAGPRTCLGKDFAYRQMKIVSAVLVRFFRFRLSKDTHNVTYKIMLTLHVKGSLNVHAIPRNALKRVINDRG